MCVMVPLNCDGSWQKVLQDVKVALQANNYPARAREAGAGGAGNWCIIVYQPKDGPRETVFTKNVGGGGLHSEPNALNKVPKRKLAPGEDVYLFSERAPCAGCQASITQWAKTYGRDIRAYYMTSWTDSDEGVDPVGKDVAQNMTANQIRQKVASIRDSFKV